MRHVSMTVIAVSFLLAAVFAGCASGPQFDKSSEASTSAIRAAEEAGAANIPKASLYLQLSKEELERAKGLAAKGKKDEAASQLTRAEADAELALTLSHEQAEKTEAEKAVERVRQLRNEKQSPMERSKP